MPIHQPPRNYRPARVSRDRFANPYFKARKADKVSASHFKNIVAKIPPRVWLWTIGAIIFLGALFWLIAFSAVFQIKTVQIQGTIESEQYAIEDMVWQQTKHHRLWMLPQDRLFMFDKDALRQAMSDKYALDGLAIHKRLPGTLRVRLTEKPAVATWFEADLYYLVDKEGWIIRQLSAPEPGLPVFYNNGQIRIDGKQVKGENNVLSQAGFIWEQLGGHFSHLNYRQLVVDKDQETLKIILKDGAIILLATDQPLTAQLERLDILLTGELKNKLPKLDYIDLRYGDKVYYK